MLSPANIRIQSLTVHGSQISRDRSHDTNTTTLSQKNDTALACYNFDEYRTILIIFGRNVAKEVSNQTVFYFPLHLTRASALS